MLIQESYRLGLQIFACLSEFHYQNCIIAYLNIYLYLMNEVYESEGLQPQSAVEVEVKPEDLSGDFNQDDEEILINPAEPTQVSLFKIVAIIIKTIIGAHIVLIPYTASILGWAFFPVVLILIIGIHHYTSILLLKCKNISRHSNFSTIMYSIWDHDASKIFGAALMMLNNLAFCILQFVLIKTTIVYMASQTISSPCSYRQLFLNQSQGGDCQVKNYWYYQRGWIIVAVLGVIEFPFIFQKRIEKLRIFSITGVAGIIAFILTLIAYFFKCIADGTLSENFQPLPDFNYEEYKEKGIYYVPSSISIIIFALNFHMNFFPIYKGLKDATDRKMEKASIAGLSSTAIIYIIVGLLGYSIVGRSIQTNFLRLIRFNFAGSFFYWTLNLSFLISVLFNVVLMFFTCKNNFISIVNIIRKRKKKAGRNGLLVDDGSGDHVSDEETGSFNREQRIKKVNREYRYFTIGLYVVFIISSLFLDSLEYLFSFLGALCSTSMVIVLPCLFYVMLIAKKQKTKKLIYYFSIVVVAVSVPFSILSFVSTYIIDFSDT